MSGSPVRVGVDIGGTFTDVLLFDAEQRHFVIEKVLTTPADPSQAVGGGVRSAQCAGKRTGSDVGQVIHGTTLVTNALIERRGAPTALITTKGFRDAVEMGREHRYDLYDIFLEMPKPLVRRRWRLELSERISADGTVLHQVDRDEVERGARWGIHAPRQREAGPVVHGLRERREAGGRGCPGDDDVAGLQARGEGAAFGHPRPDPVMAAVIRWTSASKSASERTWASPCSTFKVTGTSACTTIDAFPTLIIMTACALNCGSPSSVAVTVTRNSPDSAGVPEKVRLSPSNEMPAGMPLAE
jgi:hypothetical protein